MIDCGGCQYWDGDDGICHHPAHLGQVTQNGCEHREGEEEDRVEEGQA